MTEEDDTNWQVPYWERDDHPSRDWGVSAFGVLLMLVAFAAMVWILSS